MSEPTIKRVAVTDVKPGDKIGDFTGDHWYTVEEPAAEYNDGWLLKVRYPDGGLGKRVFGADSELPVMQ